MKLDLNPEDKQYFLSCEQIKGAEKSQMFGKPCYKVGGKAFVSLFNKTMVFKLSGDAHQEALSLDGSEQFDPSGKGRLMKEWVQVPFYYAELWPKFAEAAFEYVKSLQKK